MTARTTEPHKNPTRWFANWKAIVPMTRAWAKLDQAVKAMRLRCAETTRASLQFVGAVRTIWRRAHQNCLQDTVQFDVFRLLPELTIVKSPPPGCWRLRRCFLVGCSGSTKPLRLLSLHLTRLLCSLFSSPFLPKVLGLVFFGRQEPSDSLEIHSLARAFPAG
jgi:hypothetical protein